ncbi:transporter substrate-binding domain-containing protein [Neiella marina]|uniref:Transporter substrate-binding domain-containing protein n=1 Tax=Neiella holothuriorum TaxID=2870530 RepID=A0ABS7EAQ2_9GAMM|nr:transporter substrate-binding domain-containing protein [Neiella holothuriorum]MBW8189400.1 transporter substrate-binding domain-containing protein [Neiella holothuriorum]
MSVRTSLVILLLVLAKPAFCADVLKLVSPSAGSGKSQDYKHELLTRAMVLSEPEFGDFIVEKRRIDMKPKRALTLMQTGELMNVAVIAANDDWSQETLPVHVPVRGGTLSYRLLLINEQDLPAFANVNNVHQLKQLTAGLQDDWLTTKSFESAGLTLMTSHNFEGLFSMLQSKRVDYVPRAIYEIYDELDRRQVRYPDMVIEPTLLLHVPMVSFAYVSPQYPRLNKRLSLGLTRLADSGELMRIFNKYYAEEFARAQLKSRKVIDVSSDFFENPTSFEAAHVWQLHESRPINIVNK